MQEATTVAPPACGVAIEPEVADTEAGFDELQVKGTPVMVLPRVSTTVAVTVLPLPEVTLMEFVVLPVTASVIDCTAQVVKSRGWLFTLPLLATSEVIPGSVRRDFDLSGHQSGHGRAVGGYGQRADVNVD